MSRPTEGRRREGKDPEKSPVPGGGYAGRGVPSEALPLGHQVFSLSGLECQPFFFSLRSRNLAADSNLRTRWFVTSARPDD